MVNGASCSIQHLAVTLLSCW